MKGSLLLSLVVALETMSEFISTAISGSDSVSSPVSIRESQRG